LRHIYGYLRAKNRFYEESKKIPERFDNKSIYQYVDKSIMSIYWDGYYYI